MSVARTSGLAGPAPQSSYRTCVGRVGRHLGLLPVKFGTDAARVTGHRCLLRQSSDHWPTETDPRTWTSAPDEGASAIAWPPPRAPVACRARSSKLERGIDVRAAPLFEDVTLL